MIGYIDRNNEALREYDKKNEVAFTLGESKDYFMHGEEGLALDLLIDNLYDLKFPVTEELLSMMQRVCQLVNYPLNKLNILEEET